ncbi:MAG: hypothetical protein AB8B95_13940 [Pseudohongiellaceae bacterium]
MKITDIKQLFILVALLVTLTGCRFSLEGRGLTNNLYCDNFLIYNMCASDPNKDGVVDFVYFTASEEVFMFSEGGLERKPSDQPVHRCVRQMEDDLVATTSRLFYLDESSSALEKTDIRGAMMVKYLAYLPEITACNLRAEEEEKLAAEAAASS